MKYLVLFYAFLFTSFVKYIYLSFYLHILLCVIIACTFSLSDLADQIKKNHALLPNIERAGLISKLVEYIRVARLLAPGAHFLLLHIESFFLSHIVSFFSSRVALSSSSCIVSFSSSRIVQSFLRVLRFN